MKTAEKYFSILILILTLVPFSGRASNLLEEGMYPLSQMPGDALVKAGLKISPKEIYNPDGISLIDALVKIGGCTGSFVSEEGLIITNHHCAFDAVNKASTPEENYLENGFTAQYRVDEIPAEGYKVRITESYEDVSEIILDSVQDIEDFTERSKAISKKMKELAREYTDKVNSIEASVSEMFAGQTYILFKYRIIEDVRLVYAPPRAIGEFGGESDNWMWPRHTGDFSFMRAYVAPDGSSAKYSKDNVPFKPKKFLKINANGVNEDDFVFILGYPGRTYRHKPARYMEYQYNYLLPYTSDLFDWTINMIEETTKDRPEVSLKYQSNIKSLANVTKNFKGKLQGIRRLDLINKKKGEEKVLADFIAQNNDLSNKFGHLFTKIDTAYSILFENIQENLWFRFLNRVSSNFKIADFVVEYASERMKDEEERSWKFRKENIAESITALDEYFDISDKEVEKKFITRMLSDATNMSDDNRIEAVDNLLEDKETKETIAEFAEEVVNNSKILNKDFFNELIDLEMEELIKIDDPVIQFAIAMKDQRELVENEMDKFDGAESKLYPQLSEVKKRYDSRSFIPDANSTLRLTYGYIKGYKKADALICTPISTLDGIIEKSFLGADYAIPDKLRTLYREKDFGRFYDKKVGGVPVAILYNTDTTGGSSGSPVLNANGELIGVNFDRAFEATINDFAWNNAYSRSIGVDIRYVLWVVSKLSGANNLLSEMGVQP